MSRRRGARARSLSCCCRTTASMSTASSRARVAGIDVILTGHTHDALPEAVKVGKTLLIASGSHGKFLSRLDLDVRGGAVKDFRYKLIPLFADAIAPDAEMTAAIEKARAPFAAELAREVGRTESLLYRRGNFNGTFDDLICAAILEERDAEIALSPGFRWGTSVLPGPPITVEDIHNATAITYPQVYRMTMTGARLKEILEDVADNLFNPDPYYQQGGDMVRCGGLGYTIDIGKPMGSRISAMTHLKSGQPIDPARDYDGRRLGERERGHRRPAGVGAGGEIRRGEEDRAGRAEYGGEGRRRLTRAIRRAAASFLEKSFPFSGHCRTKAPVAVIWRRHGRHAGEAARRAARFLTAAGAPALRSPAARARRQSEEPAAQRSGLDARARRRRRGAPLRQAVEAREARHPPRRAVAHGEPRVLGELHAAARARRHHHAERAVLRAPSRRHRRDRSGRLPADAARAGRQAADVHARRPQALSARQPHLLPRMRGEFRHGVARRAAQRLPVHPRHGALRRIHRRAAERAARGGRPQDEREVAARRRRRLRRDDALDAARQGARRLPRRLSHERRDAAPRAGLSGAPRGAGLGRQHLGQVAAPHQGRRRALVHARGDVEIHRPAGERQGAPVHLRDGREVGDHLAVAAGAAARRRASR